jgi:glycerol-3-phosphate O-acyltransferase / dihydroxyacetone phosphate acyltransferase
VNLDIGKKIKITRRFSQAFDSLSNENDIISLKEHAIEYTKRVKAFGLDDHQVLKASFGYCSALTGLLLNLLIVIVCTIIIVPSLILGIPWSIVTTHVARKKAKEALKGSSVKIAGRDVMATWVVITSIAIVPWLYAIISAGVGFLLFYFNVTLLIQDTVITPLYLFLIYLLIAPWYFYLSIKLSDRIQIAAGSLHALWVAIAYRSDGLLLRQLRRNLQVPTR